MMLAVGFLVSISVDLIWLSHLLNVVSFLLVAFALPEPEPIEYEKAKGTAKTDKFPMSVWGLLIACVAGMVCMYPVLINSSLIIAENNWGDADLAGTCNAISSLGSFFAGVVFGKFYAKFPRFTPLFCAILASAGSLLIFIAPAYPLLVLGSFLVGWGFMQFFCYIMGAVGVVTPPSRVAMAMSCVLAANNLAVFIAPHVSLLIQNAIGTANYQPPFLIYAALWIIMGLIVFVWHPDTKDNSQSN